MKLLASIIKSLKENLRDWKVLIMVLLFSPFFVFLMYLFYGTGPATYSLGLMDEDGGQASRVLIQMLEGVEGQDGAKLFKISNFEDDAALRQKVKDKSIDIGVVIPGGYSQDIEAIKDNTKETAIKIRFYGVTANVRYPVAALFASNAVYDQGLEVTKITLPTGIEETFLEKKQAQNEFEAYVPGLISLAVLMILFSATSSIVKESDRKTLIRLKLSQLGAFNFLSGICIVQAMIAVIAVVLSYATALALGYSPVGSFLPLLIAGILSSLSMVAVSLVVASFLNTVFDVMTIGCFPFFILMFFSGSMFPMPQMKLFTLSGHAFGIVDILPLTHTANAFNKILTDGMGLRDIGFDLGMTALLTIVYFLIGMQLYRKRKLSGLV